MLYELWRQTANVLSDQPALHDADSGRRWTFRELFAAGHAWSESPGKVDAMAFPQGHSPEFILAVLAAWHARRVVCPLESGQVAPAIPQPPAACAHLKFTSATTGAPRWVAFTAAQLKADADNIVATMGLRPDWPNLGVISMAHSYGFSNLVLPLLLHGIPLVLARSPLPEAVRLAAESEKAVTLPAVPALWRAWHEAGAIPPAVRLAISAGAPLPLNLERAVSGSRGLKIHNFYGSTECGGIAYDSSETPRTDENCAGCPLMNVTARVGDGGCLEVYGANVGETYWPEPATQLLGNGRFQTSDLAEFREGRIHLLGRAGDVINVAGRKVSPEIIERALRRHPRVRDCVVLGVESRAAGRAEEIVVVVASQETEQNLREFALKALPVWQVPRDWWFVKELETDARGKVSRSKWRQRFLARGSRRSQNSEVAADVRRRNP